MPKWAGKWKSTKYKISKIDFRNCCKNKWHATIWNFTRTSKLPSKCRKQQNRWALTKNQRVNLLKNLTNKSLEMFKQLKGFHGLLDMVFYLHLLWCWATHFSFLMLVECSVEHFHLKVWQKQAMKQWSNLLTLMHLNSSRFYQELYSFSTQVLRLCSPLDRRFTQKILILITNTSKFCFANFNFHIFAKLLKLFNSFVFFFCFIWKLLCVFSLVGLQNRTAEILICLRLLR